MFAKRCDRSRVGTVVATAAAIGMLLGGCTSRVSGGDDKAGGAADPVVLKMANTSSNLDYHPAVQYFVDRVKELSGGALRIDVAHKWGNFAADAEQQVVRDVAAGKIAVGWVGTAVFDTVGVNAFQALTAPMLIDNNPLQQAVLSSDIPATMLAGLDKIGLHGIAVLADGLRKPIAVAKPLLGLAGYQGITFQAFRSQNHVDAIRALGATPIDVFAGGLDAGLRSGEIDGFEKGLRIYKINATSFLAPYVTANVNLWPHTAALIANPDIMAGLSAAQRGWLTKAGLDAASRSTDLTDDDTDLIAGLCDDGSRFANASDSDLVAMRQAFDSVYTTLNSDPATKAFIDRINELKRSLDPGPALAIPTGCTGPAANNTTTAAPVGTGPPSKALDGTYRWTLTEDDARAVNDLSMLIGDNLAALPWVATMRLAHGTWKLSWRGSNGEQNTDGPATYTVDGDTVVFNWPQDPAGSLTFTFTADEAGNLHLQPASPIDADSRFVWAFNTWTKIADGEPGNTATPPTLDGTYRWTITKDDALAHGLPRDKTPEVLATFPSVLTMKMTEATWELRHGGVDGALEGGGPYTVDGDHVVFDWNGTPLSFIFSVDGDGTLHLKPQPPMNAGDQFIWATEPWEKIS